MPENNIQYKLVDIIQIGFSIEELANIDVTEYINTDKIKYDLKITSKPDIDSNIFLMDLVVTSSLVLDEDSDSLKLYSIHTRSVFQIKDLKKLVIDKYLDLPYDYILTFFSLSYSTLRGILIEKLSTYRLKQLLLPIIDPRLMIPEDHKILVE